MRDLHDEFRSPQLGDTIYADDSTGKRLRVKLVTQASVDYAAKLVAARRWRVEQSRVEQNGGE